MEDIWLEGEIGDNWLEITIGKEDITFEVFSKDIEDNSIHPITISKEKFRKLLDHGKKKTIGSEQSQNS